MYTSIRSFSRLCTFSGKKPRQSDNYEMVTKQQEHIEKRCTQILSQRDSRTCITYPIGHNTEHVETIRTCELDGLNVLDLSCKSTKLFSVLANSGIRSNLISHFADCERFDQRYTALSDKRVLFNRDLCQEKPCDTKLSVCRDFYNLQLVNQYRLNGGMTSCRWIIEHDPDFFEGIYRAVLRGFCAIKRLDICADHSEDLMPWVNEDVKLGCVNGFKSHLRGSGISNNTPFFNQSIGPRSASGQLLKSFPDFHINRLHCGEARTSSCKVVFYNKTKEVATVKSEQSEEKTRIQLTLFPRPCIAKLCSQLEHVELANTLLYTMTLPDNDRRGHHVRHVIFTTLLFSRIVFTRSKYNKSTPFNSLSTWSPWYRKLFKAYLSYCMQNQNSKYTFPYNENSLLPFLADLKAHPGSIVNICKCLLLGKDP